MANDNRTLIIMGPSGAGLDRRHEGKYQCLGYNQLGRADSQELIIAVLRKWTIFSFSQSFLAQEHNLTWPGINRK